MRRNRSWKRGSLRRGSSRGSHLLRAEESSLIAKSTNLFRFRLSELDSRTSSRQYEQH